MKIVDNWREVWRHNSARFAGLGLIAATTWANLSPDLKASVPDAWLPYIAGGIFGLTLLGKYVSQPKLKRDRRND